ncbi:MAG: Gfo/Idh/MocA family oxidoreductase [candidate division KSB1 bacterium]|nr:Gfo/Idh/MocA family oxidoreductase [candidate division KSB1 bacterium]
MQAGKHVLCEKPIAMHADEAQTLLQTAQDYPHLKVMEAFMYRFHPQWIQTLEWVRSGTIGDLTTIQTVFSYYKDDPENIRNRPETGGGGLMDIGCYPISVSRFLFESEPQRVFGWMQYDPLLKVDRLTSGLLEFEDGTSSFTVSTQMSAYQRVLVFGRTGRIEVQIPFNAPHDRPIILLLEQNGKMHEITLPAANQYQLQGDAFSNSILENTPVPTRLNDAVNNMRAIDALRKSHENDAWCNLRTSQ